MSPSRLPRAVRGPTLGEFAIFSHGLLTGALAVSAVDSVIGGRAGAAAVSGSAAVISVVVHLFERRTEPNRRSL